MKAIFWVREEGDLPKSDRRETDLAKAIQTGAKRHGDTIEICEVTDSGPPEVRPCDLVLKCGVKSRDWFRAYNAAGIPYTYFDKGYIRSRANAGWLDYWRVSVNGHQPLRYVETAKHDRKRSDEMGLELKPWKLKREHAVVVDGSSGKHCYFNSDQKFKSKAEIDELANKIAADLVARVRSVTERPIIYRPKPSWKGAKPIPGTEYSHRREGILPTLDRAHALVTYGSNACFDAACHGVPSIVLGHGIAAPISSRILDEIENPKLAPEDERRQWLNNVAWTQFGLKEFASGEGWKTIRAMAECSPL